MAEVIIESRRVYGSEKPLFSTGPRERGVEGVIVHLLVISGQRRIEENHPVELFRVLLKTR